MIDKTTKERKKPTQAECDRFNKALETYKNIESDTDLKNNKITYAEYQAMGLILDGLRFYGEAETIQTGIKNFFERNGMKTELKGIGYKIIL